MHSRHTGKSIRLRRIVNDASNKAIIVPMDHGVTLGPVQGLVNFNESLRQMHEGGVDAVLGHRGLIRAAGNSCGPGTGRILHLSSGTSLSPHPHRKALTASVEDALRLGADGVSIHINLGNEHEAEMLADCGLVARSCEEWGMPLLVMIYARGPAIGDAFSPAIVAHCARVAGELGADIVKVPYTGDPESFHTVVEACCVPIVIAGGPKAPSPEMFLTLAEGGMKAGAAGLSVGRNIFQVAEPHKLLKALASIVHHGASAHDAASLL